MLWPAAIREKLQNGGKFPFNRFLDKTLVICLTLLDPCAPLEYDTQFEGTPVTISGQAHERTVEYNGVA